MTAEKQVAEINARLASDLGYQCGKQRYRWIWSEADELMSPMVEMQDGQPVMDHHCACGVNVRVHGAGCAFTWATPRTVKKKTAAWFVDQWVLCRWLEPTPEHKWVQDLPIPHRPNGYYVPVSDLRKDGTGFMYIALPQGVVPTMADAARIVRAIQKHESMTPRDVDYEYIRRMEQYKKQTKAELAADMVDAMPVRGEDPGGKGTWSAGGDPTTESPVLRPKEVTQ